MNAEQEVNDMAAFLRSKWMECPCWHALARNVLDVGGLPDAACATDTPAPKPEVRHFNSVQELVDFLDSLTEADDDDVKVYRDLEVGEVLQDGDEVRLGDVWVPLSPGCYGNTVRWYPVEGQGVFPVGYYRRPVEGNEPFQDVNLSREDELIAQLETLQEQFDRLQEDYDALLSAEISAKGFVVVGPSDNLSEVSELVCQNHDLKNRVDELEARLEAIHEFTKS